MSSIFSGNLLLNALGDRTWLSGVYYARNILSMIDVYGRSRLGITSITVLTTDEFVPLFSVNGVVVESVSSKQYSRDNFISRALFPFRRRYNSRLSVICKRQAIDKIYPVNGFPFLGHKSKGVHWIPDFQHFFLPHYFNWFEAWRRDVIFRSVINGKRPLVLSSRSTLSDLEKFLARKAKKTPLVLNFTSFVEMPEDALAHRDEILTKYGVEAGKYYFVANQFWTHKNHLVVVEALRILKEQGQKVMVLCSGSTSDYRNSKYFESLKEKVGKYGVEGHFKILGLIPRSEQLVLIKNARALIQPSKFEGWNTGVEEAKVMGVPLILSDIEVHREQKTPESKLFGADDPDALASVLSNMSSDGSQVVTTDQERFNDYCRQYMDRFLDSGRLG